MGGVFVYVLISIHTVAPYHHPHDNQLMKEYQSTFSTADKCHAVMREMNAVTDGNSWYCEKHIVE